MITTHDEAQLHAAIQRRCTALRQQLCDDVHAMVVTGALNEEWKLVADQHRETIARLETEKATLSAHLESVATERDELRNRVMELERRLQKPTVPEMEAAR
jgi:predicted nuclease with TOPRIM domain